MRTLIISGCQQFSDQQLQSLSRAMPNLYQLQLNGCGHVTDAAILSALDRMPLLQKLSYHGLPIQPNVAAVLEARGIVHTFTVTGVRSEEHTSELQSLLRLSYAVLCLKHNTK